MASPKSENKTDLATKPEGPRAIYLALDVAERGQSTAVAVLQDARTELRSAVDGTIDLAEKIAAGSVRFARKLVQKVDEATTDALKGTERALQETIENARETARAGRLLAERAVEKVTGGAAA
jgi:predicted component of type VI protein secretion system